jgi:tetratricopeptide (TPR) repeat protein
MEAFNEKMAQARNEFDQGKFEEASLSYLNAIKLVENDVDRAIVWSELSVNFYQMSAFEQAFEAAQNTLKYDAQYKAREDLYRIMGFSKHALGDLASAQTYLEKSIQIDAHSEKQHLAMFELGKLYFRQQNYDKARKLFDLIEAPLHSKHREYWLSLLFYKGFIHYYRNELTESRQSFDTLLQNTQDNTRKASGLFGQAFLTFSDKDYLKTINLCETVIVHDPDFFDKETLGFLTAASFYNLGRTDVFEKYYEQLIQRYPDGRYVDELKMLKEKGKPQQ